MHGGTLRIGALTRHVDLLNSPEIAAHAPLLTEAIAHVAHPAIRNRGTLGGSLAHADPASELPACMLALNATIIVHGPAGERRIAAEDFFTGIYETALSPQELLVAVELPVVAQGSPRTSSTSSRGGMATTPLSASRRRPSCAAARSPDLRVALVRGRRPAGIGQGGRAPGQRRRHACGVVRRIGRAGGGTRSAGGPAGVRRRCAGIWQKCCWARRVRAARPSRSVAGVSA